MLKEVMLVHEAMSAEVTGKSRLLATLDAPMLQQRFSPLVAFAASLAAEATAFVVA